MDLSAIRQIAREKFNGSCRVCPICNGKACSGEVPGMGGRGTGTSFHNNVQALADYHLNLRTIHEVSQPKLACRILNLDLSLPILGAPIAGIGINMKGALTEEEYDMAVVRGCRQSGIIAMTGDGASPVEFGGGFMAIKAMDGYGIPVIKPRETKIIIEMAKRAADIGVPAFGVDIDAAAYTNMNKAGYPVGPKPVRELEKIKREMDIPFIVKGVMTVDEAEACLNAGVDGIVVSDHGGRVLDYVPGTAAVLPAIAKAVKGKITLIADGGIRSGADVLKMLALGADAVLVGRPLAIGAVGGGADGVKLILEKFADELQAAMILTGTADVAAVSSRVIYKPVM